MWKTEGVCDLIVPSHMEPVYIPCYYLGKRGEKLCLGGGYQMCSEISKLFQVWDLTYLIMTSVVGFNNQYESISTYAYVKII